VCKPLAPPRGDVLVTGANGFIGTVLCEALLTAGCRVRAVIQANTSVAPPQSSQVSTIIVRDLADEPISAKTLTGVDTIIHLAARVHVTREDSPDPLTAFRRVNVRATEILARDAAQAGIRRLVFVSSIGVNGRGTVRGEVFTEADPPRPHNAYSVSKWEAERALGSISQETGMEVVVVRPPLVYGPRVRASFLRLLEMVHRGVPLPATRNQRSVLGVNNLVDFLMLSSWHPNAAGQIFLVRDSEMVSTSDLVRRLARAMGRPCRLVPFTETVLRAGAKLLGKERITDQYFGSLVLSLSNARERLGWVPPMTLEEGLNRTVRWYLGERTRQRSPGERVLQRSHR
jgi:nucleoside-diphosphate-sugar epimerase